MALNVPCGGGGMVGLTNAAAGTVWYAVVPGLANAYARLEGFQYNCGNTANNFTFMRPIARAQATVAGLTNVATITVDADPSPSGNTIAAGDQVVVGPCSDGSYRRGQVNTSGWNSTTKVITLTANNAAAFAVGTKVYNFGVPGDTDPITGAAFPVFTPTANTVGNCVFYGGGFVSAAKGDPLLIYNPNATNATTLNHAGYAHSAG